MRTRRDTAMVCTNEGCGRPAPANEPMCETCAIEWALFRRDSRSAFTKALTDNSALAKGSADQAPFAKAEADAEEASLVG
jgi:hypothetical protein